MPDLITEIPEEEKESRVKAFDGFYIIDEKWFLGNGYIYIEMEGLDEPIFYWQVWSTISTIDYQKHLEDLTNGKRVELKGVLQSEIPFYPKSLGLKSKVIMQATSEMHVEVKIEEESKMKEDQSKPITKERVIEIMQHLNHPELFREKKEFDKPFSERLRNELIHAEKEYLREKKGFVINISSPKCVLFQIVNSNMLESNENGDLGFGLHISFDESFEESKDEIEKFRNQDYSNDFEYHDLDGIPTCQINFGRDIERIENLVKSLIIDVYEEEIESIETDNFEV